MFAVLLLNLFAALFYSVKGIKHGMSSRKWIAVGAVMGFFALPMYMAERRMNRLKAIGQHKVFLF